jgi:hypothetical protein
MGVLGPGVEHPFGGLQNVVAQNVVVQNVVVQNVVVQNVVVLNVVVLNVAPRPGRLRLNWKSLNRADVGFGRHRDHHGPRLATWVR